MTTRVTYKTLKWLQQISITHLVANLYYLFNQGREYLIGGKGKLNNFNLKKHLYNWGQ